MERSFTFAFSQTHYLTPTSLLLQFWLFYLGYFMNLGKVVFVWLFLKEKPLCWRGIWRNSLFVFVDFCFQFLPFYLFIWQLYLFHLLGMLDWMLLFVCLKQQSIGFVCLGWPHKERLAASMKNENQHKFPFHLFSLNDLYQVFLRSLTAPN